MNDAVGISNVKIPVLTHHISDAPGLRASRRLFEYAVCQVQSPRSALDDILCGGLGDMASVGPGQ